MRRVLRLERAKRAMGNQFTTTQFPAERKQLAPAAVAKTAKFGVRRVLNPIDTYRLVALGSRDETHQSQPGLLVRPEQADAEAP